MVSPKKTSKHQKDFSAKEIIVDSDDDNKCDESDSSDIEVALGRAAAITAARRFGTTPNTKGCNVKHNTTMNIDSDSCNNDDDSDSFNDVESRSNDENSCSSSSKKRRRKTKALSESDQKVKHLYRTLQKCKNRTETCMTRHKRLFETKCSRASSVDDDNDSVSSNESCIEVVEIDEPLQPRSIENQNRPPPIEGCNDSTKLTNRRVLRSSTRLTQQQQQCQENCNGTLVIDNGCINNDSHRKGREGKKIQPRKSQKSNFQQVANNERSSLIENYHFDDQQVLTLLASSDDETEFMDQENRINSKQGRRSKQKKGRKAGNSLSQSNWGGFNGKIAQANELKSRIRLAKANLLNSNESGAFSPLWANPIYPDSITNHTMNQHDFTSSTTHLSTITIIIRAAIVDSHDLYYNHDDFLENQQKKLVTTSIPIEKSALDSFTVKSLINSFCKMNNMKSSQVTVGLSYNDKPLKPHQTLSFYDIEDTNTIIDAKVVMCVPTTATNKTNVSTGYNCSMKVDKANIGKIIPIVVQDRLGKRITLSIGMKQSFGSFFEQYEHSTMLYTRTTKVQYKFDGELINPSKTPTDYDMDENDQIDVIVNP